MKIKKRSIEKRAKQKTNLELRNLILKLKKSNSEFWLKVARLLAKPRKKRIGVNLNRLDELSKANEIIVVPGKVLGKGVLTKPITLACFSISLNARNKLALSKSKLVSLKELYEKNKEGKNLKLISEN